MTKSSIISSVNHSPTLTTNSDHFPKLPEDGDVIVDESSESSRNYLRLTNCKVLCSPPDQETNTASRGLFPANVLINLQTGKIQTIEFIPSSPAVKKNKYWNPQETTDYDCQGHVLAPGYLDIQINGAFGVDFSSPHLTTEEVLMVARSLPRFGVTGFCPTMVSCSKEVYRRNISLLGTLCRQDQKFLSQRTADSPVRAQLLGIHLEGPFFCKSKRGAHAEECIIETLDSSTLNQVYGSSSPGDLRENGVVLVTLAPELQGSLDIIKTCRQQKIIVAMGHTNATLQQGREGIKSGASLITHLFNAMRPFHHREPGLLGLLAAKGINSLRDSCVMDPYYSIIVDGLHSHPASVKLAYSISPDRVVLVTDAMAAMGLGDGRHTLGKMSVNIQGKKATISGTETLAGSVVSIDTCVKNFREFCDCSIWEAINAATFHPAKVLDIDSKGVIKVGNCADLILLDDSLNPLKTWIAGVMAYDIDDERGK